MSQTSILSLFLSFLLITGCSSKFKVESEPAEASVYAVSPNSKEKKALGKTPIDLPIEEFEEKVKMEGNPDFFTLEVVKEGFVTQKFTLPYSSTGMLVNSLNVKLKKGENKEEQVAKADQMLKKLFLAQRFALSKEFERALIELDKLIEEYPKFSRALSMKGSIYFAQKKYDESLKWYEKAIEVDPEMEETVKMAAKARKLAGRAPAKVK